jgi:MFS transporter, ACDE family, multidrug resistance protein
MSGHGTSGGSLFTQTRATWAVAFAAVVAFMGIGLVDPILPSIAKSLDATPTQTEYLFTSYLLVTGAAMFFTSFVSSRIGQKRTLLIGLGLIIVFATFAGSSGAVSEVIGFRAGWGLGNALFISTALAAIVGAASGGVGSAIILYEAALGVGIAIGPLLGGALGSISWRGPFFGTAVLMAIGFLAVLTMLPRATAKPERVPLSAPFRALAVPALAFLAATALFYNIGFFTLLAYSPFPLGFGAIGIGLTFFGWGVALAFTSVVLAPRLTARWRRTVVLRGALIGLTLVLAAAGVFVSSQVALVICIILGGLMLGVVNTVLTESVMEATNFPRAVASGAYSGVRFLGGAIAPPLATLIADAISPSAAYGMAACSVLLAVVTVFVGAKALRRVDAVGEEPALEEAEAVAIADA